jgi:bifunctional non-homologous end joining protein LigD
MAKLRSYRSKRDFERTPEPRGGTARTARRRRFVVQKHAARRLHYDLRLEHDGVMKSWAVTRGPSLVPGDRRLAVAVEDHPIEYNRFEGTIPKGEYGGGTVMIWDRGTWLPDDDPRNGLRKGHLDFRLIGKKLKGRWHLVRMKKRPDEQRVPWLLIKADDEFARRASSPDILDQMPNSVASGRSMDEIESANCKAGSGRKAARNGGRKTRRGSAKPSKRRR